MPKLDLDSRERSAFALGLLALTLAIVLALYLPAGPKKRYKAAEAQVSSLRDELKLAEIELESEEERLKSQEALTQRLQARPANFELFDYLDGVVRAANLAKPPRLEPYRTRNTSPKQPMVTVSLQGISLKQLVDLLHTVYSSGNLIVLYKLEQLHPAQNNQGLDCDITFMTIKV